MRTILLSALFVGLNLALLATPVQGQVSAGVVLDSDGLRHFHVAIGSHYGVPRSTVVRYQSRGLHYDELPVVFFMAREAGVSPETVIALRERGWSWMDVASHLGLRPAVFVRHLPARSGPPFGKAHGYWRNRGYTHLSDRQIVDFVNVHFVASYHRAPVREVIVYRDRGTSYAQIQQRYVQRGSSGASAAPPPVRRQAPAPASGNRQARPTRNQPAAGSSPSRSQGPSAGSSPTRRQGPGASASPSRGQTRSARGGANRTPPNRGSATTRPGNQGRGNARAGSPQGRGNGAARGRRGGGS
jgi:hypothetical protein